MKRKSLTLLVCLLACLALGSVGFAAWVITSDNSDTTTGQVRVDVVKDARLQVNAEIDGTIVFGSRAKTSTVEHDWMKHSILCSMVSRVIICRISDLPDGSPIMPVPPPSSAMGLFPAI